ncbi:MAG: enoyl-CoA hydratase-related protein [Sphingomonadales bacterium]|nr:enoyl-CoA hydratase-related protein [Sphingomonadales bacterium]
MSVSSRVIDGALVASIENPPVNALSVQQGVVAALTEAIRSALADPSVEMIVVKGEGRCFSAGADIADFDGDPAKLDQTRALNDLISSASKPVVMAMHGVALGGGLELALAGHYRLCDSSTKLGLPEVTLGLLPGGGGTQWLPRLIGATAAIDLMIGGDQISAREARDCGLVDVVVDGDPLAAARSLAARGPQRPDERPLADEAAAEIEAAKAKHAKILKRSEAARCIVECVEAARLSFDEGCVIERRLFERLMASEASLGLRHAFFGERVVSRIPGLPKEIDPQEFRSIAVVGAGTMGTGIALVMLAA